MTSPSKKTMASDAAMYDSEVSDLLNRIGGILSNIMNLPVESRMDMYDKAQGLMKKANNVFHDFQVEVRLLEGSEQRTFENKSHEHAQTMKRLKEDLQRKRQEIHSAAAGGSSAGSGGAGAGGGGGGYRGDGKDEARDTAGRITKTQQKTIGALDDAQRILVQTEDTANEATRQLQSQTDQIRKINEDLDVLDSEVDRAKKELNIFIRRMMTDKILICFAILVLLGIILIVVFQFVIKKKSGGDAGSVQPPPPTTTTP